MRLIDADALRYALRQKPRWIVRDGEKYNEGYTYDQVHFGIDDAPTVDAVPVVRCKDCEHYDAEYRRCFGLIGYGRYWKPDDFCSYGERKDNRLVVK